MKSPAYNSKLKSVQKRINKQLIELENKLKPFIKQKALACKCDMINTQWALTIDRERIKEPGKRFNELQDFLNTMEAECKLYFYFEVHEGKFFWL